jgi:hypothetical protein
MKADFIAYLRDVKLPVHENPHEWALSFYQLEDVELDTHATIYAATDPRRQVARRALRWARTATTAEVEAAIKEAGV